MRIHRPMAAAPVRRDAVIRMTHVAARERMQHTICTMQRTICTMQRTICTMQRTIVGAPVQRKTCTRQHNAGCGELACCAEHADASAPAARRGGEPHRTTPPRQATAVMYAPASRCGVPHRRPLGLVGGLDARAPPPGPHQSGGTKRIGMHVAMGMRHAIDRPEPAKEARLESASSRVRIFSLAATATQRNNVRCIDGFGPTAL
jgi:hypothetical protein